jgi:ssDNA-binding Zn-finger/Zn-ribbon topoisomerase 1
MSQIIRCDSCGKQLDAKKGRIWHIDAQYTEGYDTEMQGCGEYNYRGMDFCEDCMKLFHEFLTMDTEEKMKLLKGENILETGDTNPIEKPKRKYTKRQHPEEQTEVAVQQEPNRKVDEGKVMALYRAGGKWDYNYIADEMGTDPDIVRMIVMKHLRKKAAEPKE